MKDLAADRIDSTVEFMCSMHQYLSDKDLDIRIQACGRVESDEAKRPNLAAAAARVRDHAREVQMRRVGKVPA